MHPSGIKVFDVETDGPLTTFRGKAKLGETEIDFEGLLYQSLAGPNVSISLTEETAERLRRTGCGENELKQLEVELQLEVVHGEVEILRERHGR